MRTVARPLRLVPLVVILLFVAPAVAQPPPEYKSFDRQQRTQVSMAEDEILRIWIAYIGQGDGILIQFPAAMNYAPAGGPGAIRTERVELLIDGGSSIASNTAALRNLIDALYDGGPTPTIEHAVVTHHDQDHVVGVTKLLDEAGLAFGTIYHNGLVSYRSNASRFPDLSGVVKNGTRAMAHVRNDGTLKPDDLVDTLADIEGRLDDLQSTRAVYRRFIDALVTADDEGRLGAFRRAHADLDTFVMEEEEDLRGARPLLDEIEIELLWPNAELRSYGSRNWGKTINGNSVTFRLVYRDFEMLFTGDHNTESQERMIEELKAAGDTSLAALDCDVLKVPHHGSDDVIEQFFRRDTGLRRPVLGVASMGVKGFSDAWKHPSERVRSWLGGAHRLYSTHIHERHFRWSTIGSDDVKRDAMVEGSHILIETNGRWFRVVEVPIGSDPTNPPTVAETRRGNGTRWIRAKPGGE